MNVNAEANLIEEIVEATVKYDDKRCVDLARQAMDQGMDPVKVIQDGYSRGMQIVGDKFATLEYCLPEVMLAADAMDAATEVLKPHLMKSHDHDSQGIIVLGVIQGDIHDLGKNIVKIMLRAAGFTVHDLGNDTPVRQFIEKAEAVGADIIAASAILTTTMSYMPDISTILNELGLRDKYMIMLGGAPVIADWAIEVGADGYGEDAVEAVEVAKNLMRKKRGG
ncbi:MAG: B12-binding domain-containing protein [Desulfobacterales bacterium]|nr:MAG: B12-binding domain-containing protein [Desulfobacterales bacterium]